jgi:hypothetical protein
MISMVYSSDDEFIRSIQERRTFWHDMYAARKRPWRSLRVFRMHWL